MFILAVHGWDGYFGAVSIWFSYDWGISNLTLPWGEGRILRTFFLIFEEKMAWAKINFLSLSTCSHRGPEFEKCPILKSKVIKNPKRSKTKEPPCYKTAPQNPTQNYSSCLKFKLASLIWGQMSTECLEPKWVHGKDSLRWEAICACQNLICSLWSGTSWTYFTLLKLHFGGEHSLHMLWEMLKNPEGWEIPVGL